MTKPRLLGILTFTGLAALVSCDNGSASTVSGLDPNDCPYGTFRPMGLDECVFPANDLSNSPIGVSDNRCSFGQPASPPQCVGENGERAYLSTSSKCAPGYRFFDGACNRNGGFAGITGAAGTTGFAGGFFTGTAGGFGVAGFAGSDFTVDAGGFAGAAGDTGAAGAGGSDVGGSGGTAAVGAADASADAPFSD